MVFSSTSGKRLHEALQREHAVLGVAFELPASIMMDRELTALPRTGSEKLFSEWLQRSMRDEYLRELLADVLNSSQSPIFRLFRYQADSSFEDVSSLLSDLRVYQQTLLAGLEQRIDQEHQDLTPFFEDWKQLVVYIYEHHLSVNQSRSLRLDMDQLYREWSVLEEERRIALRPLVSEYTRVVGFTFSLPEWFMVRAEPFLA